MTTTASGPYGKPDMGKTHVATSQLSVGTNRFFDVENASVKPCRGLQFNKIWKTALFAVLSTVIGTAAEAVTAVRSTTLDSGLQLVPAKYWLDTGTGPNARGGSCEMAHDGVVGGSGSLTLPEEDGWLYLDFGSPRTVDTFAFAPRSDSTWMKRANNFKVAGSLDGENWTVLHEETENQWAFDTLYYHKVNSELQGPYRYVRFYDYDGKPRGGNITEACVYTPDSLLFSAQANPWGADTVAAADDTEGVSVSVTFKSLAYNQVDEVVAYASQTDHVADYAAWVADNAAVHVSLGTGVAADATVTGKIPGCANAGLWYWQTFALVDGQAVAHGDGGVFTVGAEPVYPTAYVLDGVNANYRNAYDGNVSTILDAGGAKWIVFDLSSVESGKHLASLRLWAYDAAHFSHLLKTSVDFGYADGDPGWTVTGTLSQDGSARVMNTVSGEPYGITWKENVQAVITSVRGYASPITIDFMCDTVKAKPRYLRLKSLSANISLREAEIRVTDDPDDWAHFNHQGFPGTYGTPSVAYGQGLLPGGEAVTVTMPETAFFSSDGQTSYNLDGWTLVITNTAGEVLASTSGSGASCTFTPPVRSFPTLTWNWTSYGKVPAEIRRYDSGTLTEYRQLQYAVTDGNLNTFPNNKFAYRLYDGIWDFGTSFDISWMRFAPRSGAQNYMKDMQVLGSNVLSANSDDWALLYDCNGEAPAAGWTRVDFNPEIRYRYIKVARVTEFAMAECEFWSQQTQVATLTPCTWSSAAIDSPEPTGGITAEIKLYFSTNAQEHVLAYAAHSDYGDNRSAWVSNAESVYDCGTVKAGNTVSAHFAGLGRGVCYWRAFAVDNGGKVSPSQSAIPFVAGTVGSSVTAYINRGDESNSRYLAVSKIYDGIVDSSYPTVGGWIVFDLKDIPSGYRPAALRIWTRPDTAGSERLADGEVRLGYSDGTEDWQATAVDGQPASRPLFKADNYDIAGITWSEPVGEYFYHYFQHNDTQMEYPLPTKMNWNNQKPRYLLFRKDNQEISLREIELRLVKKSSTSLILKLF